MMQEKPIFVVGISRSGTKLLRDILNNHPGIHMPNIESKFIPPMADRYLKWDEMQWKNGFNDFFLQFKETSFYEKMSASGIKIDPLRWYGNIDEFSYAGVVAALFILLAKDSGKPNALWGDKTPNYLLSIPLLKKLYPGARIIHIIRDVRDVALSARKAWNRNLFYTAFRWRDYIRRCQNDAQPFTDNDYLEIKYETLLSKPESIIQQVCRFINIPYQANMLQLAAGTETVGDAKGSTGILFNNTGKWHTQLTQKEINKIESICFSMLKTLDYPISPGFLEPRHEKKLTGLQRYIYIIQELVYRFRVHRQEKGFASAVKKEIKKFKARFNT
jgi:hypothetical protein